MHDRRHLGRLRRGVGGARQRPAWAGAIWLLFGVGEIAAAEGFSLYTRVVYTGRGDHPRRADETRPKTAQADATPPSKRAIRLSLKWRAVYEVKSTYAGVRVVEFAEVQEVHPHDY